MKKQLFSSLLIVIALAFTGCSDGGSEGTGNGASSELSADPLVGAWFYNGPPTSSSGEEANFTMSVLFNFGSDGTFDVYLLQEQNSTGYLSKCSSTYSTSGNQLAINAGKCDDDGHITQSTSTYSVNGDQLTFSSGGESATLTKWAGNVNELHAVTSSSSGKSLTTEEAKTPYNFWVWSKD